MKPDDDMQQMIPRRRDDLGDWHNLVVQRCPECGCKYHSAKDDPQLVWEPGSAWDVGCTKRDCHCHAEPLIGLRREE